MGSGAISRVLVLALALALGLEALTPAARAQNHADTEKTAVVLDLINRARVDAGLLPLARSTELDAAAQAHSIDMVQHDYLDHTGSDGSQPQERADRAGYHVPPNSGWIVVEVISAISADPAGPVDWWLGDDQHRKVLLSSRWREVGVGYAQGGQFGNYWTADFGCRPGVLPTVVLEGVTYTHSEECGDPNVAVSLAAQPTAMPIATPTVVPTPFVAPSASLSAKQTANGVTVSWSGIAAPSATDWIGLYRAQDPDTSYQDWAYVSCSKSSDQPRDSGSCTMRLPTATDSPSEVRLFRSNGYTRLARSDVVTSESFSGASVTLNVSPVAASPGTVVNVQWRGIDSPSPTDWIGLYRPGDADSTPVVWQYLGCAQIPLDARPLGSCNVLLPTGLLSGSYEFRLFSVNGYTRLGLSPALQIH